MFTKFREKRYLFQNNKLFHENFKLATCPENLAEKIEYRSYKNLFFTPVTCCKNGGNVRTFAHVYI